jgi:hypothetical protein
MLVGWDEHDRIVLPALNDEAGLTDVDHSTEFGGTDCGGIEGLMNVRTLEDV